MSKPKNRKPTRSPARAMMPAKSPTKEQGLLDILRRAPDLVKLLGWWDKWGDTLMEAGREIVAILKPMK